MNKIQPINLLFMFLGGLLLLFVVAPLSGMILATSPESFLETIARKEVTNSIILTILTSFGGTLFFSFLAIPLAYLMARHEFPGKKIVSGIIDLPVVIPHTAAGIRNNFV